MNKTELILSMFITYSSSSASSQESLITN